jgi:hypothetical protein
LTSFNGKLLSKSMLIISVTLLGALVVSAGVHSANATGTLGLVKGYGRGIGSAQPYEPAGPWIDGVQVPQFLTNQNNEWTALKAGALDLYDSPITRQQLAQYNTNICVPSPDIPNGTCIDPAGSVGGVCPSACTGYSNIQHEIQLAAVNSFDKFEIDMQNALFPTNLLGFRQAMAFATDKEQFIVTNLVGGAPDYAIVGCPALCDPISGLWANSSLNEIGLTCFSYAAPANPMPYTAGGNCNAPAGTLSPARLAAAAALLDAEGFPVVTSAATGGAALRVDSRADCATRTLLTALQTVSTINDCGLPLQPVFYIRNNDPPLTALGLQLANQMIALHISMCSSGCTTFPGQFANEQIVFRRSVVGPVFLNFQYNLYTGGWSLGRDPTYIDDLYDTNFIRPGNTNYPNFSNTRFDIFARGLRAATSLAAAKTLAYSAELWFNYSVPIIDVWTDTSPHAYRVFHLDTDPTLNGLRWEGIQNQIGVGPDNKWTWLNAHLVGAPLHDPNHPVFIKWGWNTDVLDNPNPVNSWARELSWDRYAFSPTYDTLNNLATDDPSFTGDMPWMASLPVTTVVASGATFPNGEVCTPDAPAIACSVLSYQLRPDLTFAASLDRAIPALPVTAYDVRLSIFDGKNSPTSFLTPSYVHVQDVVVKDPLSFDVYERNVAVWARHDIGGTPIVSVQHWCQEAHDAWTGGTLANCLANPGTIGFVGTSTTGWPDAGVNVLSSKSGHQLPGPPVGVDLGSYAFTYDSEVSFPGNSPNGPILYRVRQTPGLSLPTGTATCQPTGTGCGYSVAAPSDAYFTNDLGGTSAGLNIRGWNKFHLAGNINWYCTATTAQTCSAGITSENGPLPSPDSVINIVDLSIIAVHFGETPGTSVNPCANVAGGCPFGAEPWDISGATPGTPDGTVNILDLTRVSTHFGQSFLGGTDQGGGAEGIMPLWIFETGIFRTTTTKIMCSPTSVTVNPPTAANCTATAVTDTSGGTVVTPIGFVQFTSDGAGAWNPPFYTSSGAFGGCELVHSFNEPAGESHCGASASFTPSATGTDTITGLYVPLDNQHSSSSATLSIVVS